MHEMGKKQRSPKGHVLLAKWRESLRLKQQEAANLIGIDLARYNAFEHERARPGLDWAFKIEDASAGEVPARSWAREPKGIAA